MREASAQCETETQSMAGVLREGKGPVRRQEDQLLLDGEVPHLGHRCCG